VPTAKERSGEVARKVGATRGVLLMAHLKVRPTKIDKSTAKARGNGAASGRRCARISPAFGGSPRIHARGGALQRSGELPLSKVGFSPVAPGLPAAKADFQCALFRWTEVQLPLLKQGAPTQRPNR
jgi:hypothetical protein